MKEIEREPWAKWVILANVVLWALSLVKDMEEYSGLMAQEVAARSEWWQSYVADCRFELVADGFCLVAWALSLFLWRQDPAKLLTWIVRVALMAAITAAWAACYPLAAASDFPLLLWWGITVIALGSTVYALWRSWKVGRQTRSLTQDEMI